MNPYLPHKNKEIWKEQKKKFKEKINNINDIINIFYNGKCYFFKKIVKDDNNLAEEFIKIFNYLQELALNLEQILDPEIPLLKKGKKGKVELTRKQAALIFLLSFLNMIDLSQEKYRDSNSFSVFYLLNLNYNSAFQFGKCFLNYLIIIGKWLSENNKILDEKILYLRDTKEFDENIFKKETKLCQISIFEKGSLFDGKATYGVDFANMYIGGGALSGGCVQEEILFAIEPEATVSMFFMEVMEDNDAIRIDNTIQYSNYSGYGYGVKYENSAININDLSKIKRSKIIAIDASVQNTIKYGIFNKDDIIRDINKAYIGFNLVNIDNKDNAANAEEIEKKSIATGNWGCGAFGGDHELKFLQQWVAASFAGIERLDYYIYESKKMSNVLKRYNEIREKYINANALYNDLVNKYLVEEEVLEILLQKENNKEKGFFTFFK